MISWRIGAAMLGAFGVVAAAWMGWALSGSGLPSPDSSNPEQLLRWLVTEDLKDVSEETHVALVNRFVDEANQGWDVAQGADVSLSTSQKQRLTSNLELLKQVWFFDRVRHYADLEPELQFEFLRTQIRTIDQWTQIAAAYAPQFGWPEPTADDLFAQIDTWVEASAPEQLTNIETVLRDGLVCWLATQDLGEQPLATRQELMRRIVQELEAGNTLSLGTNQLSRDQQERLQKNSELLVQAWVFEQLVTFAELPSDQRGEFVEQQVSRVRSWGILQLLAGPKAWQATEPSRLMELAGIVRLRSLFEEWIASASPSQQEQLRQLRTAVQEMLTRLP